jgi:CheY-like chemotaxis protein
MDLQMPEMDGLEATAKIRQMETVTGGRTPIVAMTAHAMTGDQERCLIAGMDAYLSKPIRPEQLLATIDRLVVDQVEPENVAAFMGQVENDWDLLIVSAPPRRNRIQQLANVARHRILVVDDSEDSAATMAMLLRAIGQEVEIRNDGIAALDWLTTGKADVVLLDISMPGMDGYEVARRIRALPQLNGLVLVALTGYGQNEDRQAAFDAGFDHHLVKPVGVDALRQLLEGSPVAEGRATI